MHFYSLFGFLVLMSLKVMVFFPFVSALLFQPSFSPPLLLLIIFRRCRPPSLSQLKQTVQQRRTFWLNFVPAASSRLNIYCLYFIILYTCAYSNSIWNQRCAQYASKRIYFYFSYPFEINTELNAAPFNSIDSLRNVVLCVKRKICYHPYLAL